MIKNIPVIKTLLRVISIKMNITPRDHFPRKLLASNRHNCENYLVNFLPSQIELSSLRTSKDVPKGLEAYVDA